jgi:hypothetical protein
LFLFLDRLNPETASIHNETQVANSQRKGCSREITASIGSYCLTSDRQKWLKGSRLQGLSTPCGENGSRDPKLTIC